MHDKTKGRRSCRQKPSAPTSRTRSVCTLVPYLNVTMNDVVSVSSYLAMHWSVINLDLHSGKRLPEPETRSIFSFRGSIYALFWIDSDVAFKPDAAIRLLLADRDVVSGIYPIKRLSAVEGIPAGMMQEQFEARIPIIHLSCQSARQRYREPCRRREFLEVAEALMGFMVIKRHATTTERSSTST